MQEFLEFTLGGIAVGMIYAAIALSLVLIWRGTRVLNYSQGGMAMFTTYMAWVVIRHTGNYWLGFVVALAFYKSRARLAPPPGGAEPAWQPHFPGVEYPPPGSDTRVVHPRAGWSVAAAPPVLVQGCRLGG